MGEEIQKLIRNMERAWGEVDAFLATLTDAQKTLPRDVGGWAIKDHLIHMAVWEDGIDALLSHESRDAHMGFDANSPKPRGLDNINDAIFRRHQDKTLHEVMERRRDIHDRLVQTLQALEDADVSRPIRDYDAESSSNQPVLGLIVGNTAAHYRKHLRWMEAIAAGE